MARKSQPGVLIAVGGVAAVALLALVLGAVAFGQWTAHTDPPMNMPTVIRPMLPNCGEVFYCINASDPNPSYVAYWTPTSGPVPAPWIPAFRADTDVFDVTDPFSTRVRITGTYEFVVFTPLISLANASFSVAIVLTRDPGLLLASPALSGDLGNSGLSNITQIPTRAATTTAIAHLSAGERVRVGYVVDTGMVEVTPGAYFAGTLLARG